MFPLRDLCELCDSGRKVNPQNISPSSKTAAANLTYWWEGQAT